MKKPSIFSKDYEKKLRKIRRRKIIFWVVVIVVIIILGVLIIKPSYIKDNGNLLKNVFKGHNSTEEKISKNIEGNNKNKIEAKNDVIKEKEIKKEPKVEEKKIHNIEFKLKDDLKIRSKVEEIKGEKTFKEIEKIDELEYILSKDKKSSLIFNNKLKDMYLIYVDGKSTEITRKIHYTNKGAKIDKDKWMTSDPNFIWVEKPRLFNEKVFYLSKLPNLSNKYRYFIWVYDIKSNSHYYLKDGRLRGYEANFGNIKDNKLEVNLDGKKYLLSEDGSISN
ncbi:hypothetical protein [Hathewaya massiliensis]|uniref:hypothetical protein n=1 Tax=Hathewaya massiliensis TaxID=1964382 RepID=UPI001157B354|nr:hypothetical protein [Hathewaya massiliensis]